MRPDVLPAVHRAAFEHAPDAVLALDEEGRVLAANGAAVEMLDDGGGDLVGRPSAELYTAAPGQAERAWSALRAGGLVRTEVRIVGRDGRPRYVRVSGQGHVVPGVHLAILRDVTSRRERDLSSRRYELLRQHTHDVVLFIDDDGRIVEANHAAEETYGYTRDELLALRIQDLRHDGGRGDFGARFREAFETGAFFETVHRRKDGTPFPVEVGSRAARVGEDVVLLSVIRDMTERHELQARLLQADRLSTFGMMAAGIAHEINNPLAYVLANAEVLSRTLPRLSAEARAAAEGAASISEVADGLSECEAMLRVAMEGLERVRSIIRDLKTFSRRDTEQGVLVDLHQILNSALNIAQSEVRHRARIERRYGEVPPVRGSTSRLGQVFLNLIVNGAQAIPVERRREGVVTIATRSAGDGWAVVEITDNGVGIPPEVRPHLFEPFHTTKRGEGTGLGLYISRTILEAHGGRIELESAPGAGTTVRVLLPPYDPASRPVATPRPPRRAPRQRVLVVDDELAIGEAFRATLAPIHDVTTASSVREAKAALAASDVDVVLCDVMMGDGTGLDLFDHVLAHHERLAGRFVLMSGGVIDRPARDRIARLGLPCLDKPVSGDELRTAIDAAASRGRTPRAERA